MRSDPPSPEQRGSGCLATLFVGAFALLLPVFGVLLQFASDPCSANSPAFFCGGAGQQTVFLMGLIGGWGIPIALGLAAGFVWRETTFRKYWLTYCAALQALALVVMFSMSSQVS